MRLSRLSAAIMACGFASAAGAGGFALSEQSVSAMGTANAGRASNVQDASVVYNNPAAIVLLKQAQVTGAVAVIDASTKISNVNSAFPSPPFTNDGDMVPLSYIPSFHLASGDKGGWAWGISSYGSFGLKTNYEDSFAGRHLGDKSSVKVTTVQPAVSFAVNDKVRVGAGLTLNYLEALLSKNVSSVPDLNGPAPGTIPGTVLGTTTLKGTDYGYGFNLGLHTDLTPDLSAGVVYRSKVKYKVSDGTLTTTGTGAPGLGGAAGNYSASTGLDTPESVELALSHKLDARTTLHAGSTWTRWSRFKELVVQTNNPLVGTTTEIFNWKDSVGYSVGVSHACDDRLTLRAGLAYDNSPVNPADRSVRLPSADRRIASLGAGYRLSPVQQLDASYSYIDEEKATVRQAASGYSADFHNRASVFGLQYSYKF